MAHGNFEDLRRRTVKYYVILQKIAFDIAKYPKYECQKGLASISLKLFDKKSKGDAATPAEKSAIKSKTISNQQLANELHKPIIKKFEKRKVYLYFKDNVSGADLADMQSISTWNKGI